MTKEWEYFGLAIPSERLETDKDKENPEAKTAHIRNFVKCMTVARNKGRNKELPQERLSLQEWEHWFHENVNGKDSTTTVHFHEDSVKNILDYSRRYFLQGNYELCIKWLEFVLDFICEVVQENLTDEEKYSAQWGLACALLLSLPAPAAVPAGITMKTESSTMIPLVDEKHLLAEETANRLAVLIVKLDEEMEEQCNASLVPVQLSASMGDNATVPNAEGVDGQLVTFLDALLENKNVRDGLILRRIWLLHWAAWVLFRYYLPKLLVDGRASFQRHVVWGDLLDWFFRERNISAVLLASPHLLRYYAVLAILNRNREDHFKAVCETVRVASQSNKYYDPFTSLLEALFVDFDFDQAQQTLSDCNKVAQADFFLCPLLAPIEESSRLTIFETYCRIHKSINIDMIAQKVNMTSETAEKWIVNLIRHAKLDAKIDSERNRVEISTEPPNFYNQVVEKTQNVTMRSHLLIHNIEKPGGGDIRRKGPYKNIGFNRTGARRQNFHS
eukprot:Lankesteria_metandrocarpae@DN9161_c0_g1_i1.p1